MLVMAATFCKDTAEIWQLVGQFLLVFKIVIPIILIVLGMIDLGKAVISSDEKAISKSAKSLALRIVAAVVIFFIPTLIGAVFKLVGQFKTDEYQQDYEICKTCITKPNNQACSSLVDPQYDNGTTTDDTEEER